MPGFVGSEGFSVFRDLLYWPFFSVEPNTDTSPARRWTDDPDRYPRHRADVPGPRRCVDGHGARDPDRDPRTRPRERGRSRIPAGRCRFDPEAIESSEVVVLAVPFAAVHPFVSEHRVRLRRRILIDISNPFDALDSNLRAGAELTADALGTREGLVAAFKDNFAATIRQAGAGPVDLRPHVKIAGDDEEAKAAAATLAHDLNHRVSTAAHSTTHG